MCFREVETGTAGDEELVGEHLAVWGLDSISSPIVFSVSPEYYVVFV